MFRLVHSGKQSLVPNGAELTTFGTRSGTRMGIEAHTFRLEMQRDLAIWSRAIVQGAHAASIHTKEVTAGSIYVFDPFSTCIWHHIYVCVYSSIWKHTILGQFSSIFCTRSSGLAHQTNFHLICLDKTNGEQHFQAKYSRYSSLDRSACPIGNGGRSFDNRGRDTSSQGL